MPCLGDVIVQPLRPVFLYYDFIPTITAGHFHNFDFSVDLDRDGNVCYSVLYV